MTGFRPVGDDHAIEVVAFELTFAEPLSRDALTSVDAASREFDELLPAREPMRVGLIKMGDGGVSFEDRNSAGFQYSFVAPNGVAIRHMRIDEQSIRIERRDYSRWAQIQKWSMAVLAPILSSVLEATRITHIGLHYSDAFEQETGVVADPNALFNRDTTLIAPRIFDSTGSWHSHAGYFDTPNNAALDNILERFQVNVTAGDNARVVITSSHIGLSSDGLGAVLLDQNKKLLVDLFDLLHERNKALLSSLLSSNAQQQISLHSE